MGEAIVYHVMHMEKCVAQVSTAGECKIYLEDFMPYDLVLEESDDFDTRINNVISFHSWCVSRLIPRDRTYAKEILNSIGASQSVTDRERAQIALSYHCLSLLDVFWVKGENETVRFEDINLYTHSLSNALVDIALRGHQMTVTNAHLLANDLSTGGCYPKAWVRREDGFYLYKDGGQDAVEREVLASKICRCFDCHQVLYEQGMFENEPVSISKIMTSQRYSLVTYAAYDVYCTNHDWNTLDKILELDAHGYYMMNILDYLVGNIDRHWENWGLLVDNETNQPIRLHDLMDFNRAFQQYDTLDGANCLTVGKRHLSQREAAVEAIQKIGVCQIYDMNKSIWDVIYAEVDVLEYLKNCGILENRSKRVFSALFRRAFKLKSYVDVTRYRIVYSTEVDCNTLKEEDGTIKLYVPITRKFMLAQSELICENLRDCELYTDFTREIIREKSANINLSIHGIHCGGSEADTTIKNEVLTGECRPIACIMDSDKKCENDKYGSSAQKAIGIYEEKKETYPIELHVLAVRMKENFFPPEVLTLETNIENKEFLTALIQFQDDSRFEEFFKFFNFKDGVTLKRSEKVLNFRAELEAIGIIWPSEEQIVNEPDKILVPGIGANGLGNFHKSVLKHQLDERYEKMVQFRCKEEDCEKVHQKAIKAHCILQYVKKPWEDDWKAIEQLVIDFGIAFPETMTFVG